MFRSLRVYSYVVESRLWRAESMYVDTIFMPATLDKQKVFRTFVNDDNTSESVPVKALRRRNEELVKSWKKGEKRRKERNILIHCTKNSYFTTEKT